MANQRILIIEDDVFLGDVLVQKLKGEGYTVALTRDGGEGLKKLREMKPDLLLLDIVLPTMGGYEILEEKVNDAGIASIPTIIISNSGQPVEINRALSLGVRDYIVKAQFSPEEVLAKIRLQLDRTGASHTVEIDSEEKKVDTTAGDSLSGKAVLVVEDDAFLHDILVRKLSGAGAKLLHATDSGEAFESLRNEKSDIVLLDILLPGQDGFEVLRQIRAKPETKALPVILLSNLGQKSDIDKGKQLGANRFLIKATASLDEIVNEIQIVLREAKLK
ncbi:MAG: two-component histidine kinase/response regulator motif-containing protein [Parcubacteria group bacterium Gr01-1014_17]|nr:MAG: two-component histidine kinase/response regulator motif-containing protein [Parcubacteria group bacterium Gr01-1014_17]